MAQNSMSNTSLVMPTSSAILNTSLVMLQVLNALSNPNNNNSNTLPINLTNLNGSPLNTTNEELIFRRNGTVPASLLITLLQLPQLIFSSLFNNRPMAIITTPSPSTNNSNDNSSLIPVVTSTTTTVAPIVNLTTTVATTTNIITTATSSLNNTTIQLTTSNNPNFTAMTTTVPIIDQPTCCTSNCGLTINQIMSLNGQSVKGLLLSLGVEGFDLEENYRSRGSSRIIGGQDTLIGDIPWQVSFQRLKGFNWVHFCGGTVLNSYWIITAAHCFAGATKRSSSRNIRNIRAVIGTSTIKPSGNFYLPLNNEFFRISQVISYPLYDSSSSNYDLALVKLLRPMPFYPNAMVNSICLPNANEEIFGSATVSGYGRIRETGSSSNSLKAVNVSIRNDFDCLQAYGPDRFVPSQMICAGDAGRDSCQGDSGGPLFKIDPRTGRYTLYGVVSYGYGCGRPNYPGIYTKISSYTDWIRQTIDSNRRRNWLSNLLARNKRVPQPRDLLVEKN